MKTNFYQKFILILYLIVLLTIILFFIPFKQYIGRYNYSTTFDSLWAENKSVDFTRFLVEILVVSFFFLIIYLLLSKKGNPDLSDKTIKKKIKKEIVYFLLLIGSIIGTLLYMGCYNYFTHQKERDAKTKNELILAKNLIIKHECDSLNEMLTPKNNDSLHLLEKLPDFSELSDKPPPNVVPDVYLPPPPPKEYSLAHNQKFDFSDIVDTVFQAKVEANKGKIDSLQNIIKQNKNVLSDMSTFSYYSSDEYKRNLWATALISFLIIYVLRFEVVGVIKLIKFLNS